MNCLSPLIIKKVFLGHSKTSAGRYKYVIEPTPEVFDPYSPENHNRRLIPCRKCAACLDARREEIATLAYLEGTQCPYPPLFVTLTYDPISIPTPMLYNGEYWLTRSTPIEANGCINKDDLVRFIRALRREHPEHPIRYLGCGEYGPHSGRPHYHLIVWGIELPPHATSKLTYPNEWTDCPYIPWHGGRSVTSYATQKACSYVASYVSKKMGNVKKTPNKWEDLFPPFISMSHQLGTKNLAREILQNYAKAHYIQLPDGVKKPLPRAVKTAFYKPYKSLAQLTDVEPLPEILRYEAENALRPRIVYTRAQAAARQLEKEQKISIKKQLTKPHKGL